MSLWARNGLNLGLVVVVAALAALAYFRPGTKPAATGTPLPLPPAAEVNDVRIELAGNNTAAELKRIPGGWQLLTPYRLRADGALVQELLDELNTRSEDDFPAGTDLARYGLAPPLLKLWLNGKEIDFGNTEPVNNHRYIHTGGRIYLSDSLLFYRAAHSAEWWLDKHLLPAGAHVTALQLPEASLSQDKAGRWQLAPRNDKVSADAIQTLVNAWQQAAAVSVTVLGKGQEQGEVSLTLAGQAQPLRFAILKDDSYFVLARPDLGLQYEFDSGQRTPLLEFPGTAEAKLPKH